MNYVTFDEYQAIASQAKIKLSFLEWQDSDEIMIWINIYGTMLFSHDKQKRKVASVNVV